LIKFLFCLSDVRWIINSIPHLHLWWSVPQGGGVVRLGYMLFNTHLCNHILLQSGGETWVTTLYTVRGVGSGSRDVDTWRANVSVRRGSGDPSTDGPGTWQHCGDSMLRQHCPSPRKTWPEI
jgi:hypothetical protein